MAAEKPPTVVELRWDRDLVFSGTSGTIDLVLDSASKAGPSPMQALAFGLAGCMAMDVVHVLTKGRFNIRALDAKLVGQRAPEEPRRFTAITLHYTITGDVPTDKIERAIALSREKYCSVWHSMRHDIDLKITYQVVSG
jgi:putative redox protein